MRCLSGRPWSGQSRPETIQVGSRGSWGGAGLVSGIGRLREARGLVVHSLVAPGSDELSGCFENEMIQGSVMGWAFESGRDPEIEAGEALRDALVVRVCHWIVPEDVCLHQG